MSVVDDISRHNTRNWLNVARYRIMPSTAASFAYDDTTLVVSVGRLIAVD
ncbi:MAG: hypothetical protein M0008_12150 [Actinomycetota bacterium]|nr:hypothetical protein [Actinomycetota bacterium]